MSFNNIFKILATITKLLENLVLIWFNFLIINNKENSRKKKLNILSD